MYQMVMKKVENWIFWIIGNFISIPIYIYKGMILTVIEFIILIILSIIGYIFWYKKASLNKINK